MKSGLKYLSVHGSDQQIQVVGFMRHEVSKFHLEKQHCRLKFFNNETGNSTKLWDWWE